MLNLNDNDLDDFEDFTADLKAVHKNYKDSSSGDKIKGVIFFSLVFVINAFFIFIK